MKRTILPALAAAVLLAGCGGATAPEASTSAEPTPAASVSGPPLCSDLFREGQPIDYEAAKGGCAGPDGILHSASFFPCNDGTHLWQMDAKTGAEGGYGFDGEPYVGVVGDPASDEGYSAAYAKCNA